VSVERGDVIPGKGEARVPAKRILLVDCDMFYVQVARLDDPEGVGKEEYLLVGGSPTGRGVVTSASYSVRAFGVRSGMPTAQALQLCPRARVVPVSRRACAARSRTVREALEGLSPVVQGASIDEFYLDLSGTERLFHQERLADTAKRIREEVLERTGISVSVGGGTRKLIAKLAAGRAKPGGVHVVPPGDEGQFMRTFRLGEIPGVGPALAETLNARGLTTVEDLLPVDRVWLDEWLGPSRAQWLWERARGLDSSRVNPEEERKSVSSERTFATDLTDDGAMDLELLRLVGSVGRTLRRKGLEGKNHHCEDPGRGLQDPPGEPYPSGSGGVGRNDPLRGPKPSQRTPEEAPDQRSPSGGRPFLSGGRRRAPTVGVIRKREFLRDRVGPNRFTSSG
jgi:DNA polymerase-4